MDKIRQDVLTFLKSHGVMTLSTSQNNQPWCATVYYGINDDLVMYIVTDPDSVHGKHLKENNMISICVFDSHTKITETKQGIQATGTASQVTDIVELTKALILWHRANPGVESKITIEDLKKFKDTRIYKIKLSYIKFYNKILYAGDGYAEIKI